jgi:hypothetical protein
MNHNGLAQAVGTDAFSKRLEVVAFQKWKHVGQRMDFHPKNGS